MPLSLNGKFKFKSSESMHSTHFAQDTVRLNRSIISNAIDDITRRSSAMSWAAANIMKTRKSVLEVCRNGGAICRLHIMQLYAICKRKPVVTTALQLFTTQPDLTKYSKYDNIHAKNCIAAATCGHVRSSWIYRLAVRFLIH